MTATTTTATTTSIVSPTTRKNQEVLALALAGKSRIRRGSAADDHHYHYYHREGGDARFVFKRAPGSKVGTGVRHHAFPIVECPYPVACDRETLDLDVEDQEFVSQVIGSPSGAFSFVDWTARPTPYPKRVLDLGCGNGSWILSMAQEWPSSRFYGLDVVPVHLNLAHLPPEISKRVEWIYGNFLRNRLPFADGFFDFVHIKSIGKGVPEDQWDVILEEVARVLKPGGAIEVVEEDIFFPFAKPPLPLVTPHDPPPSTQTQTQNPPANPQTPLKKRKHSQSHPPPPPTNLTSPSSPRPSRGGSPPTPPASESGGSLSRRGLLGLSHNTLSFSSLEDLSWGRKSQTHNSAPSTPWSSTQRLNQQQHHQVTPPPPVPPLPSGPMSPVYKSPSMDQPPRLFETSSSSIAEDEGGFGDLETLFHCVFERRFVNMQPTAMLASLLNIHFVKLEEKGAVEVFLPSVTKHRQSTSAGTVVVADETRVALQLHRVLAGIMACKEAMWEELLFTRQQNSNPVAASPEALKEVRAKFEALLDRYRSETQARCSMRDATERGLGWKAPKKDPLPKNAPPNEAEAAPRPSISAASIMVSPQDEDEPFRRIRVFVAFKGDPH